MLEQQSHERSAPERFFLGRGSNANDSRETDGTTNQPQLGLCKRETRTPAQDEAVT